jgi:hypothetical protein
MQESKDMKMVVCDSHHMDNFPVLCLLMCFKNMLITFVLFDKTKSISFLQLLL